MLDEIWTISMNHLLDLRGWQRSLLLGSLVNQESLSHPKVETENSQDVLPLRIDEEKEGNSDTDFS